jgi:UDP-3-O-[3-hydroxymyristoyl] glucosamine N-acyltransferase
MAQPAFFKKPPSSMLAAIAASTGAQLVDASRGEQRISSLASLNEAGPMQLTFFDNHKYAAQ